MDLNKNYELREVMMKTETFYFITISSNNHFIWLSGCRFFSLISMTNSLIEQNLNLCKLYLKLWMLVKRLPNRLNDQVGQLIKRKKSEQITTNYDKCKQDEYGWLSISDQLINEKLIVILWSLTSKFGNSVLVRMLGLINCCQKQTKIS